MTMTLVEDHVLSPRPRPRQVKAPLKLVGICGSTNRPSKSRALLEALAGYLSVQYRSELVIHDLVEEGAALGSALSRRHLSNGAAGIVRSIEEADALIVTCPVYKGSYPGLFKHLFDLIDAEALVDRPVLIGATGGGPRHALIVEHQLRPLFGFFMALSAPTAVYACDSDFVDGRLQGESVVARAKTAAAQFAALVEPRRKRAAAR